MRYAILWRGHRAPHRQTRSFSGIALFKREIVMRRISIEEHFFTAPYLEYLYARKDCPRYERVEDEAHRKTTRIWETPSLPPSVVGSDRQNRAGQLLDLREGRLNEMDKAGIDVAVLSLGNPGVDAFDEPDGSTWARKRIFISHTRLRECTAREFPGLTGI